MFPQTDPGGKAVIYNPPNQELPENVRPNDATISLYEERRFDHIKKLDSRGRLYTIKPKVNKRPAIKPNPAAKRCRLAAHELPEA